MKTDTIIKDRKDWNATFVIVVMVAISAVILVIPIPTILLDILMAVNWVMALCIFLVAVFTKDQRRTKNNREKTIPEEMTVSYILPAAFLLYAVFGLAVYITFTRLILAQKTGLDSIILLSVSDLVHIDGTAGIIAGVISLVIFCVVIVSATRHSKHSTETAAQAVLNAMPEAAADIERTYTGGEISEETVIAKKDHLQWQVDILGAMEGVGKFIAGNAKIMICIMAVGVFGGIAIMTVLHGKTIQEAVRISIAFGIVGGISFYCPSYCYPPPCAL
jgi:flagellar biosynthesis component FlhA